MYSNLISLLYMSYTVIQSKLNIQIDSLQKAYIGFFIFSMISFLWTISLENSTKVSGSLFSICVLMLLLSYTFKEIIHRRVFVYGLFVGILINYLLLINLISLPIQTYENMRFMGTLGKSNILAIACIFYLVILIVHYSISKISSRFDTVIIITSLLICAQLCLATGSRKGLVGYVTLAILFVVFLFKERATIGFKNIPLNIAFLTLLIFYGYNSFMASENFEMSYNRFMSLGFAEDVEVDGSTLERSRLFDQAINLFFDSPFIGSGVNSFKSTSWSYSHSNIAEILSGLGILGFFIYYRIHFTVFLVTLKKAAYIKFVVGVFLTLIVLFEYSMVSYYDKYFYICIYFVYFELNTNKSQ